MKKGVKIKKNKKDNNKLIIAITIVLILIIIVIAIVMIEKYVKGSMTDQIMPIFYNMLPQ